MSGIKANVTVKLVLRPENEIMDELNEGVIVGLIKWVQLVVREAVKPPPEGSPFDTGHNRRSIGWMVSPAGRISFGTLSTSSGKKGSGGVKTQSDIPVVALATSSGYGGWLEIGTRKMHARPYLVPSVKKLKPQLDRLLSNVI